MLQPDEWGHFGIYGGRFVSETLIAALEELSQAWQQLREDPGFLAELDGDLARYVGRPTPLYHAERLSRELGGAQIHLKREDLNHTGAHKVNNTVGQALLAKHMGKTRIIAETGAGQHGVATATVAARLGMRCQVYMGEEDVRRQALNVYRMKLLGAEVIPVTTGSRTLKDAMNEAMRDWVTHIDDTFYIIDVEGVVDVGHPDRRHLLHHRHRRRPPPLPAAGARTPGRHWPRGASPEPGPAGQAARCPGGLRGRGLQCHRPVSPLSQRRRRRHVRRRGGRAGVGQWPACSASQRRPSRRAARQPHLSDAG